MKPKAKKNLKPLEDLRLGKLEHEQDRRTLMMANFMRTDIFHAPPTFDHDKNRAPFPMDVWGNDEWGNCVKVDQAHSVIRSERREQRRTLKIKTDHVVDEYKAECLRQFGAPPESPGDGNDNGLVMLQNFRNWRNTGWSMDFTKKPDDTRTYKIAAYGELEPQDVKQIREAIYLFGGIHMGFWLPVSAAPQTREGYWDVVPGPNSDPGSWGGHAVHAKRYDKDNIYVLTWGYEIRVSNAFVQRYCDEAWATVDDLDNWRRSPAFDLPALVQSLNDIGARVDV